MKKNRYIDTDYLHVSAVLRVRETQLLSMDDFNKVLSAKTYEDSIKMLGECGYDIPSDLGQTRDFEKIITGQLKNVYSEIIRLSNGVEFNKKLLEIFLIQYDFMNLKSLIKSELLGISPKEMLFPFGNIPVDVLEEAFRTRNKNVLGKHLYDSMEKAFDAYSKDQDPQMIDLVCDKEYFEYLLSEAKESGFKFLVEYALLKIDITNVISLVRIKNMNKNFDFFKDLVYSPGKIGIDVFENAYSDEPGSLSHIVEDTSLNDMAECLDAKPVSLSELEKKADEIICGYIKELRRVPFGAEVVASYILAKEMELKNTRIVLAGKLAGISSEYIRERMRVYYV